MANEVPESISREIPRPPAPRERPVLRAAPGPSPEELHGTIGPAENRIAPPPDSPEARLSDAAGMALAAAAGSSLPGAVAFGASDVTDAARNGMSPALALGLMTYGRSAARLADPRRAMRSLARNPNYSAHRLKRRTGYERGLFGLGVETHGDASFRPSVLFAQGRVEGRLADLAYMHRDVQAAYPGMENLKVRIVPDAEWKPYLDTMKANVPDWAYSSNGFTAHGGGGIVVRGMRPGEAYAEWFSRADSTLAHEMQHVAQEADGIRAPYPHPTRDAYRRDAREVDARNTADRRTFTGDERYAYLRRATQDMPPEMVNLDDKGGDNFGSFRNFLATDDVPESIFGFPVVQRDEDYTESDLKFFKENPRAAGFYDMGDDEMAEDVPQQAAKAKGAKKVSYDDLRRLADTKYAKDADPIKAAVYSLSPEVVSATVDSFEGNIDRTSRPVYLHKDAEGWVTGYSTTNSGDALDPGTDVSSGKFKAVLVPFIRFGNNGKPEYTEDHAVAQKWYDESGQHYGKFDMDFTSEAARKRSVDRFNAASWLVHREQQLRYQPVFDKLKTEADAARLRKLWADAVKTAGGDTNGMAKVFYAMTGESAPNQRGASTVEISNGYRVRLAVHGNETRRKRENPHNKALADTYTNLGTLEKDSDVIRDHNWGTGPGTNWFDVATMQPRYEAIARDPTALAATRSLIVDAARFLNGGLSVPGLPSDAYYYGDGRKGLVSDAEDLSAAEMKAIGPLPKNFHVGRRRGR